MSEKLYLPVSILLSTLILSVTIFIVGGQISGDLKTGFIVGPSPAVNPADNGEELLVPATGRYSNVPVGKVASFNETGNEICLEGGKPVVYLFFTTWCPHCKWIKETFDETVANLAAEGKIVAYHWEVDTFDNALTSEVETGVPAEHMKIYQEFNPGQSILTFVFGCKYFRIGNAYESTQGLGVEKKDFEEIVAKLLG